MVYEGEMILTGHFLCSQFCKGQNQGLTHKTEGKVMITLKRVHFLTNQKFYS